MRNRCTAPALILLAALAGCTGEGLSLAVGAPAATNAVTADTPFNPFSDQPTASAGRREVIQNPSIDEIMRPGKLPEMALGRKDAPVTIVEYASLTCPYCRRFHVEDFPALKREYIDTGKVRFVLRAEFPIGRQSGLATIALRCAPPGKYFELYEKLMLQQRSWVSQEVRPDPIFKVAQQVGMTRAQFDRCRENRGMIDAVSAIKERGRTLGIIGTPNFFIQGKLVKSAIGINEIRQMVDPILVALTAAPAGAPASR